MKHLAITTNIAAPVERVWQVMIDVGRWHEWTPSIVSIELLDPGPIAVGSRVRVRQPKLPPAVWTVTEIEPGRSFTWTSSGPGFRTIGRHWVEPSPGGSRATLAMDFEGPLGGFFGRLTGGISVRYIGDTARGLKARSEDPTFRHGAVER